jgi:hypothetical protein
MKLRRRETWLLIVLAVLVGLLVKWKSGGKAAAPARPAEVTDADAAEQPKFATPRREHPVTIDDIPALSVASLDPLSVPESTPHRNLFRFYEKPAPPPPPPKPAPPQPCRVGADPNCQGPIPPPPPPPKPVPPPISFHVLGSFGPKGEQIAVLILGDKIQDVQAGAVVDGKFIIQRINYESVDVGFVGFPASQTQRLGFKP